MRLVADTNILFTFFWKNSLLKILIVEKKLQLISPDYALNEIRKYKEEIKKQAILSEEEFDKLFFELQKNVTFIPLSEYEGNVKAVAEFIRGSVLSDEEKGNILNDIDFLTVSLKFNSILWSNDTLLKKQKKVSVITTKELIDLLAKL